MCQGDATPVFLIEYAEGVGCQAPALGTRGVHLLFVQKRFPLLCVAQYSDTIVSPLAFSPPSSPSHACSLWREQGAPEPLAEASAPPVRCKSSSDGMNRVHLMLLPLPPPPE